ncbi:glycosyltransferase family 25 protein [Mannheimia sp. E30BD]|uniref:glycosyltransferase family 25 protein n=1 Tax=Mannheimia sp. E30BD TaxID=3278708 RepID=UPI00359D7174
MLKCKNYVISLPSAEKRRKHILREFASKNVNFEFFDAFSPSEIMDKAISELIPELAKNQTLTNGEKGCLLSHLALWKKCIDDNLDYIAIFEDDVLLSNDISTFLNRLNGVDDFAKNLPLILKLETFLMPVELDNYSFKTCHNRNIQLLKSVHYGTAGYIISNSGAKYCLGKLYKEEKTNIVAIDQIIFNQFLNNEEITVYQLSPALCIQELQQNKKESSLDSQIEVERKSVSDKLKPSFIEKLLNSYHRKKKRKLENKMRKEKNYKIVEFV